MTTLIELANLVGGTINGDEGVEITGAEILRDVSHGQITFVNDPKHTTKLAATSAAAVVMPHGVQYDSISSITVANVDSAFATIVAHFRPTNVSGRTGVSNQAIISESAEIADDVTIYPGAVIGDRVRIGAGSTIFANVTIMDDCQIGSNSTLFPSVVLYEYSEVGDRCIIHANSIIGAYGFGYKTIEGKHRLSVQLGNVRIENDVEIGAGTTIDRGTYSSTVIGEGTKIDNQVMIANNCRIGKHNLFCSQVGIAGSCTTGDYVVMGGQVGIGDHIDIGNDVMLSAQSGVMANIEDGQRLLGSPALPIKKQMQNIAIQSKMPELRKRIKQLENQVKALLAAETQVSQTNSINRRAA